MVRSLLSAFLKCIVLLVSFQTLSYSGKNTELSTLLYEASRKGNTADVKLLLNAKADVNAKTKYGSTALMVASQEGYSSVVKLLLEAKAIVNAKTDIGSTALMIASQKGP